MEIKPRGLNESLTIDVEIICDCPCEKPGYSVNIHRKNDFSEKSKILLDIDLE